MAPLEARINGEWHQVIGYGAEVTLPNIYPNGQRKLPAFLQLDNGMQVHPDNPQLAVRLLREADSNEGDGDHGRGQQTSQRGL